MSVDGAVVEPADGPFLRLADVPDRSDNAPFTDGRGRIIIDAAVAELGLTNVRNEAIGPQTAGLDADWESARQLPKRIVPVYLRVDPSTHVADRIIASAVVLVRNGYEVAKPLTNLYPVGPNARSEAVSLWEQTPHDGSLDPRNDADKAPEDRSPFRFEMLGEMVRDFHDSYSPQIFRLAGVRLPLVAEQWQTDFDNRKGQLSERKYSTGERIYSDDDIAIIGAAVDDSVWRDLRSREEVILRSETGMGYVKLSRGPKGEVIVRMPDLEWLGRGPREWDHMAPLVASVRSEVTKRTPQNYRDFAQGYGADFELSDAAPRMLKMRLLNELLSTSLRIVATDEASDSRAREHALDVMARAKADPRELLAIALGS